MTSGATGDWSSITELPANRSGSRDRLEPPNEKPHIVLPTSTVSAHRSPLTGGSVLKVYPNALAFVDHVGAMRGYLAANGLMGFPLTIWGIALAAQTDTWLAVVVLVPLAFLLLAFIQYDFVGFRYQPVLVNRGLGQVHVFVGHMLPWWQWFWKLWGRSGWEVQTYDWRCIRAEVIQFTIFSGQVPRRESALVFAVTDAPGSNKVIQRFGVGPTSAYGDIDSLVRRWEHIRRFMQGEGPVWVAGDAKFQDFSVTFWDAATFMQPLFNPMFKDLRESPHHWWWIWPLGVAALIGLPLTAPLGIVRWLSYKLNAEPVWPKDVLQSLGGPELSDEQLAGLAAPKMPSIVGRKKRRPALGG
jgi:hypothetical protein